MQSKNNTRCILVNETKLQCPIHAANALQSEAMKGPLLSYFLICQTNKIRTDGLSQI